MKRLTRKEETKTFGCDTRGEREQIESRKLGSISPFREELAKGLMLVEELRTEEENEVASMKGPVTAQTGGIAMINAGGTQSIKTATCESEIFIALKQLTAAGVKNLGAGHKGFPVCTMPGK